jgi:RNA-binding protein 26
MIIEEEATKPLKNYLIKHLEPICAAEPEVLATYVVALLRNDKPRNELQDLCTDQLEDFLKEETKPFVTQLFEVLKDLENKTGIFANVGSLSPSQHEPEPDHDQEDADRDPKHARREPRKDDFEENSQPHRKHNNREGFDDRNPKRGKKDGDDEAQDRYDDDRRPYGRRDRPDMEDRDRPPRRRYNNDNFERPRGGFQGGWSDEHKGKGRGRNMNFQDRRLPQQKQRCRDYDERGFCMRGELCPFDHGVDRIIVEDVQGLHSLQRNFGTPMAAAPAPVMPQFPIQKDDPFGPLNKRRKFEKGASEDIKRLTPGPMGPMHKPMDSYDPDKPLFSNFKGMKMNNPMMWGSQQGFGVPQRNNNVEGGPGAPSPAGDAAGPGSSNGSPENADANQQFNKGQRTNGDAEAGANPQQPQSNQGFNPFHKGPMGPGGRPQRPRVNHQNSTTLLIANIPQDLNSIERLHNHFKKFGTIVNIQVKLSSSKAFVQFSQHSEAEQALQSPEAVFGNRFIKVFWSSRFQHDNYPRPHHQQQGAPNVNPHVNPQLDMKEPQKAPKPEDAAPSSSQPTQQVVEAPKPKKDMIKELLKKKEEIRNLQIKQQKEILEKLSSAKNMDPQEKQKLVARLNSLTESIKASLQKDSTLLSQAAQPPKPLKQKKLEKEKELLDRELDTITQVQPPTPATAPVTTAAPAKDVSTLQALKNKLSTLQQQAASMGLLKQQGQGKKFAQARPRMVLDNRTTTLRVDNLPQALRENGNLLRTHFQGFGEITSITKGEKEDSVLVQFAARRAAELAVKHGKTYENHPLGIAWYNPPKPGSQAPQAQPSTTQDKKEEEDVNADGDTDQPITEEFVEDNVEFQQSEDQSDDEHSWKR